MNITMMCKQKEHVTKYLARYAQVKASLPDTMRLLVQRDYVVVIPTYKENTAFIERLSRRADAEHILLIVILNEPDNQLAPEATLAFKREFERLVTQHQHSSVLSFQAQASQPSSPQISQHQPPISHRSALYAINKLQCLVVDHTAERALPSKYGVGLARKIGADIAVALMTNNCIKSPWIFSTDADSQLPPNYFHSVSTLDNPRGDISAVVFQFKHVGQEGPILRATERYEACIKYYQSGLQSAGSPYAFYTLGSCLAVSLSHYCAVRGFPKKAAGEDFYLLNKLAKIGRIHFNCSSVINIEARLSDRVPFGTGPATSRIAEQLKAGQATFYYNPMVFEQLKSVLDSVEAFWLDCERALHDLSPTTADALRHAGLLAFTEKRRSQDASLAQYKTHFHGWFDAFQTLKFIHFIERHYKPVPFPHA